MRLVKITLGLFAVLLVASSLLAQKIVFDYDHNANFSQYRTFTWIRPPHYRSDPFMDQHIMDAVNAQLTAKGWRYVTEGGDVGVVAHVATREEHSLETFYDGFGGGWGWRHWGGGFGEAITMDHPLEVGTLVVDLFDTRTKQLIWRGEATESLSEKPDKDVKKLNKAVDKLFRDFPPK